MSSSIDYKPPTTDEPILRRCRVPELWGKLRMDLNNNPAPCNDKLMECSISSLVRPCTVRLVRCQVPSSPTSLVWDVEKVMLEDQTVQIVYRTVRMAGGGKMETGEGKYEAGDDPNNDSGDGIAERGKGDKNEYCEIENGLDNTAETGTTDTSVNKVKQKFSVELKTQVINYSQTHSVKETCRKFCVSRSSLLRWRNEKMSKQVSKNALSHRREFKLKALNCKKFNGNMNISRIFKIPISPLSTWENEVNVDKDMKTDKGDEIAVRNSCGELRQDGSSKKNEVGIEGLKVVAENS